eukprot:CAMPEP_0180570776 /NCGR_PEP_ID=MMETSP1037_2-20121125/8374_1 /TAXON_ID=632150 /ORGANISM="Azadinium spinosum, Strain 3D9" /LENGTH=122 /DNA_ID=CAMNT_0022588065 /DNA_START=148 /DNA_END=512 /DNA_ORIENTATION=+
MSSRSGAILALRGHALYGMGSRGAHLFAVKEGALYAHCVNSESVGQEDEAHFGSRGCCAAFCCLSTTIQPMYSKAPSWTPWPPPGPAPPAPPAVEAPVLSKAKLAERGLPKALSEAMADLGR